MLQCQFKPIAQWPRPFTKSRRNSPFSAGYNDTLSKLETEIDHLRGRNIVIQTAMQQSDIRQDGWPRANARKPSHPGVVISFDSRHGPLSFACDEFHDWESNLRGIALTLERLRLADLYGVTKHGEQYRGWQALPPPPDTNQPTRNMPETEQAARWFATCLPSIRWQAIQDDVEVFRAAYRHLAAKMHPDAGGNHDDFVDLQTMADILKRKHGI